jgi:hypothetical protein
VPKADDDVWIKANPPFSCCRDHAEIKCLLDEDGTGIDIIKTNSATYFHKEAVDIHLLEESMGTTGLFCKKTKELHQVTANQIQNKKEHQVQSTCYNFSKGYSLMNFVDGKKGVKVKNKFCMQPIKLSKKKKKDKER